MLQVSPSLVLVVSSLVVLAVRNALRLAKLLRRYVSTPPVRAPDVPDFLGWSACTLSRAIKSGNLRSVDVVDACIAVLKSTSELNAIVSERFAEARKEALQADAQISSCRGDGEALPPFLGVPIIMKEAVEYPGVSYTYGLVRRRGALGHRKGPVVRRIEDAGFIVLGFGNTSEACMWMESYNCVYGRTSSPFDMSRTPGGSSGGTAAGVAVLGSPIGVTADIGGSTRIPAFFCGLFGHKATGGRVANTGTHVENCHGAICRICQTGHVTRHAEDLLPFLKIIAGPPTAEEDPQAAEYLPYPSWSEQSPDFSRLRVIPLTFRGGLPRAAKDLLSVLISSVSGELREGQARVVEWFKAQGCQIQPMHFEDLRVGEWFGTWADRNQAAGGPTFRQVLCGGKETFGVSEIFSYMFGKSHHTLAALGLAFLEDIVEFFSPPQDVRLQNAAAVEGLLDAALGDYGVFILPVLPKHGCKHDELLLRILDSSFTCIWNALEFPATAVPLGLADGLPLGVQIVSKRGNDELTISLAAALEKAGIARCVAPGS